MTIINWRNQPLAPLGGVGPIEEVPTFDAVGAKSIDERRLELRAERLAALPEHERGESPVQVNSTTYTPDHDVIDTLPDGRCILACAAGMPMPIAEARRRGLIVAGADRLVQPRTEPAIEGDRSTAAPDAAPRTKRTTVLAALAADPTKSDRQIARELGVTNTYVSRLRKNGDHHG